MGICAWVTGIVDKLEYNGLFCRGTEYVVKLEYIGICCWETGIVDKLEYNDLCFRGTVNDEKLYTGLNWALNESLLWEYIWLWWTGIIGTVNSEYEGLDLTLTKGEE